MEEASWGLMGRDVIGSSRRVRALGLGATVRNFNDAAVPGLGGLSYGKQLLWSLLGIHVADIAKERGMRVSKVEVANAIEAMACIVALKTPPVPSGRIRGQQKLHGKNFCAFSEARKSSFYVSQPMRMSLVQPLLHLGLVEQGATRFNAYVLSGKGHNFLELACAPYSSAYQNKGAQKALLEWVMGKSEPWQSKALQECLNPSVQLSKKAKILFRGLLDADTRRRDALLWMQSIVEKSNPLSWAKKPAQLTPEHWHELHAGALLFTARDAAIEVLETVEKQLDKVASVSLSLHEVQVGPCLKLLRIAAQEFLNTGGNDTNAITFCNGCIKTDETEVLRYLIDLDGRVLRLVEDKVLQGEAFQKGIGDSVSNSGSPDEQSPGEVDAVGDAAMDAFEQLPGISYRIKNLLLIYRDLRSPALEKMQ